MIHFGGSISKLLAHARREARVVDERLDNGFVYTAQGPPGLARSGYVV